MLHGNNRARGGRVSLSGRDPATPPDYETRAGTGRRGERDKTSYDGTIRPGRSFARGRTRKDVVPTDRDRAAADPPMFDVVGTLVLLVLATLVSLWLTGKIFRIGILRTGQPPKLLELLRWVRG